MKYFESHLPPAFVRIHRSCIVNSEVISRVELFGKESYNVYLKDGNTLKASTTGYKFLKEKLSL
jgi:DNA-binding LytR/AlgR family response regulator